MVTRLLLYLFILGIGALIGFKGHLSEKLTSKLNFIQNLCLLFLLFIMGIRIGVDEKVLSSFFKLGYQALIMSVFAVLFSILCVKLVKGYVIKGVASQKNHKVKTMKKEAASHEF
ncbi:LysO family transporter [Inediibacterium massiliense]|uniref:LysO family transporter n=1 Tax=Inediibacterium massiliense TaxID=1658111 RepID=UPI0018FE6312|nr:LysO family transporter [Inediibacterium massiliense]